MRDDVGTLLGGRYELREQVGMGGAGAVYRAHDRVLGREVAVKRLRVGTDADARARLRVEARISGALAHPGIARVHDYGEEGEGAAASPYLVMEYVDGRSLRDLVREDGPLPSDRVMSIVAQVADALAVAHEAGVIHRDVKPGNIIVRADGRVSLVDFGIARGLDVEPLTLTGNIVGTVDYISPEQADGQGATWRSDLYSLGMVAYECLTGIRPLRRDSQVATLLAHLHEDVPALPPTVPAPVRDVVHRLAAREPRRRPADAATAARLARAAIGVTGGDVAGAFTGPSATGTTTIPRRRRRRWVVAGPLAAAAACAAYLVGSQTGSAPAPAATVPEPAVATPVATPAVARVPAKVRVPVGRVVGATYADAARALAAAGLVPAAAGATPSAGARVTAAAPLGLVPVGSTVRLTVAAPPAAAPVPVVTRTPARHAAPRATKRPAHAAKPGHGHGKAKGHAKGKKHGHR